MGQWCEMKSEFKKKDVSKKNLKRFTSGAFQSFDRVQFFESLNAWASSSRKSIDPGFEVSVGAQGPGPVRGVTFREVGAIRFIPEKAFSGFSDFDATVNRIDKNEQFIYSIPDLQIYDREFFSETRSILGRIRSSHPELNGLVSTRVLIGRDFSPQVLNYEEYDHVFSYVVEGCRTIKTKGESVSLVSGNCLSFSKKEGIEFVENEGFVVVEFLFKKNDFNEKFKRYFLTEISGRVSEHLVPDYYSKSSTNAIPQSIKQSVGLVRASEKDIDPEVFASRVLLEMVSCAGVMPVPELVGESFDLTKAYDPVSVSPLYWSIVKNGKYLVLASCGYSAVVPSNKTIKELVMKVAKGDRVLPTQILSSVATVHRHGVLRVLELLYSMGVFQTADRFVFDQSRPFKSEDFENRIFSARVTCMIAQHES